MTTADKFAALRDVATRLRIHSVNSTTEAGSGHPTSCCSAADIMAALFFAAMRFDPKNPKNPNNDRFVLSKGHAAPVLYAAWAEAGYVPVADLMKLRTFGCNLEGHPTPRLDFVDVATGSLGQGLSAGVGMALAARLDKRDYHTWVLTGDGESAEGSIWEAAEIASYYKLNNLTVIADVNRLGQSQPTMLQHDMDTYKKRFAAFGWKPLIVDGHDMAQLVSALRKARRSKDQPVAILAKTIKGKGISFCEDKEGWHGRPLKKGEEHDKAIAELQSQLTGATGAKIKRAPREKTPDVHEPAPMDPPAYKLGDAIATREAYGTALAKIGAVDPRVVALDGDTKNSTFSEKFLKAYPDRFFEEFIAEQNMVGVAVGLASRGKVPFASTFACFMERAVDQVRMAVISFANMKLVGSHAGVSIGEDGPSQMALEDIAIFRAMADSVVLYPCDAVSTERAVELAANHVGLVFIRTSRPKTPVIYDNHHEFSLGRAHVLRHGENDRVTVVAAGVTVFEALKAYDQLKAQGTLIRVIDLFSVKPVDRQLLIESAKRTNNIIITVEDHHIDGGIGDAVAAAVSPEGVRVHKLAVHEVPRSGKPEELMHQYGISAARIAEKVRAL
ncbi:MAG TPA: transketolase [Verrucomicrobiae bacterium]|nr:transketolase [Verrucomicrobiae bacterium]